MGWNGGTGLVPSRSNFADGATLCFGSSDDACLAYDTTDPNAAVLILDFEKVTANDVPIFVVGDDILGVDLGFFDGIIEPGIAVVDDANGAAVRLGFTAVNRPAVMFHGSAGPLEIIRAGLPLVVQNTTVQADDQVLVLRGPDQGGAEAIGDEIYLSFEQDTADGMTEVVRLTSELLSPIAGTTDARFSIDVMTADSLVTMLQIDSSAAGVITTTIPTGDLILNDNVSLLLGTASAESDLSSDGANTLWNLTSGVLAILGANTVLGSGEGHAVTTSGQTLRAPDMVGGTTVDAVGADLTIAAGLGTGNGDVGTIIFSLPDRNGASNSTLQDRATRLTLDMALQTTILTMQAAQGLIIGTDADDLALQPNANITTTRPIVISPVAAGTFIDFRLETQWVSGTLIRADFGAGTTFTGAVIGMQLDFQTNVVATSEQSVTGILLGLPAMTVSDASPNVYGIQMTSGAVAQSVGGTTTYVNLDITTPAVNLSAGTVTSYAVQLAPGAYTAGTQVGIFFTAAFNTAGIDLNTNTIIDAGNILAADAAGPAIVNAAATATVPTLIPNRAELDTGIGWQSDVLHVVLGGVSEYSFSTTILDLLNNTLDNPGAAGNTWAANVLTMSNASSTSNMVLTVENTSNDAAANHAYLDLRVGGTTSLGDPHIRFTIPSGTSWYMGPDNNSVDEFIIGTGATVGANNYFQLDGRINEVGAILISLHNGLSSTIASGASNIQISTGIRSRILNYTGNTQVSSLVSHLDVRALTIAADGVPGTLSVNDATGIKVVAPTEGSNVFLGDASAIRIVNASGDPTNQYGIYIEDLTVGGSDYGIYLAGADTAAIYVAADGIVIAGGSLDLSNQGSLINVGVAGNDWTSTVLSLGDDVLIRRDVNATITASTTQTQGNGALTAEVNEVSTVAFANDTVTLPTAAAGLKIVIINNGANNLRIFPASSDNLGVGVDTATTLAAGSNVVFVAYDDTNWEIV